METTTTIVSFGDILRDWRKQRRLSQMELGLSANVSARHISFIESGRSKPSREMILQLANTLQMSKSQINQAHLLAGYAPYFKEIPNSHADHIRINNAINTMLHNHLPYPAIVTDKYWNIINANSSAQILLTHTKFENTSNLVEALIADNPETSTILNWVESVALILQRMKSELFQYGTDKKLSKLAARLEAKLDEHDQPRTKIDFSRAVIPTLFKIGDQQISVYSTIAQFGTVFDLNLSELRVEMMFPADTQSEEYFNQFLS